MAVLEIGRICIKKTGRSAGKRVVIVDFEKNFPIVDGLKIKRKKCNSMHLFPTDKKLDLSKGASHEEVLKLLK